jgi:hypothetical protein
VCPKIITTSVSSSSGVEASRPTMIESAGARLKMHGNNED